jgi:hypothetical protein
MSSPSVAPAGGSVSALLLGTAAGAAGAAWLDIGSFAGYVSAALAAAVFAALAGSPPALRLAATACALSFPLLVVLAGETGLLWGPTITFAILACASVLRGLRPGLVASLALAVLVVVYVASLGSHLVLIKEFRSGSQMVTAFLLMTGAYETAAALVAARRRAAPSPGENNRPWAWFDWRAGLAGALACEAVALASRYVIELPMKMTAVLILGLAVAGAAMMGNAVGAFVAEDVQKRVRAADAASLRHVNAVLLAAPAFYYGFRLYLS